MGEKLGFLPELKRRMNEHPYRETEVTTGCLCWKKKKPNVEGGLKDRNIIVAYNAVLEALILTNMGSGALSKDELIKREEKMREKEVEDMFNAWQKVRRQSAANTLRAAFRR